MSRLIIKGEVFELPRGNFYHDGLSLELNEVPVYATVYIEKYPPEHSKYRSVWLWKNVEFEKKDKEGLRVMFFTMKKGWVLSVAFIDDEVVLSLHYADGAEITDEDITKYPLLSLFIRRLRNALKKNEEKLWGQSSHPLITY